MKNFLLFASAAAMAVSMPALAKPDKDGGKGNGQKLEQRGGGGDDFRKQREKFAQEGRKQNGKRFEQQMKQRDKFAGRELKNREKFVEQRAKQQEKFAKNQRKAFEKRAEAERKMAKRVRDGGFENRRSDWGDDRARFVDRREGYNDCPPGLAKKNNGCLPPGQAKKFASLGQQMNLAQFREYNIPASYRSFYNDSPEHLYRYDDNGYIYRVDRDTNLVSGLIPLLGGGFGVGQVLPTGYDIYNVPLQYRDTYYDTDDSYYRYGDNAIYQVDPQTNMIESVVALLTGQSLGVGQTMPAGYDMYNVPLDYRDQYYDTDEYNYRYADGNIYQVDAKTQIIQAIISALT